MNVSISYGNRKMGAIPSVSLPPIKTCRADAPCCKDCYAVKLCKIYKTVRESYENNLQILLDDRIEYFRQIEEACKLARFFRWHVSGDIPDGEYLIHMVMIANRNPKTEFLAFTKQYETVNHYISANGALPKNLHIIFSGWNGCEFPNPYNLPTSEVIFKDTEIKENWKICGGNCAHCACQGIGCWELKDGETIAFYKH